MHHFHSKLSASTLRLIMRKRSNIYFTHLFIFGMALAFGLKAYDDSVEYHNLHKLHLLLLVQLFPNCSLSMYLNKETRNSANCIRPHPHPNVDLLHSSKFVWAEDPEDETG